MSEHVPLYASAYAGFGVREQVRHLAYGDDLGQSGWVTADELERFARWLELVPDSRLLDVGCGSGGPDPVHRSDNRHRSRHGYGNGGPQRDRDLCVLGRVGERALLARAGFDVSRREDLTENMAAMAGRWHDTRAQFRDDLLVDEGEATFVGIQRFLAASHVLARERRLSRYAYLARRPAEGALSQDDRQSSA